MATYRPRLNPALLAWGRKSLRLTEERASQHLGVTVDALRDWELGMANPTIAQLRTIAERYRRPLGVFFLPQPPQDPDLPHDFRIVRGGEHLELSPELLVELRRAHARRELALELLEDLERAPASLQFRAGLDDDPEQLGRRVRQHLGIRLEDQGRWTADGEAFNGWKAAAEARGVLVFQARRISYEELRGFSLSENPLPVIVVNGSDFANSKTFTLVHEFVHLALRLSGICDPYARSSRSRSRDNAVEVFCNHVAGAALVPATSLLGHIDVVANDDSEGWSDASLLRIARSFAVSTLVVARRLWTLGRTSRRFYEQYHDRVVGHAERLRKTRRQEGAPPRPVMVVADLGRTFTGTVLDAHVRRIISAADVSQYLRVKVRQIPDVQDRLSIGAAE